MKLTYNLVLPRPVPVVAQILPYSFSIQIYTLAVPLNSSQLEKVNNLKEPLTN